MSRTYRKPKWYIQHSDVSYANRELARHTRFPYKTVKVKKTEEEMKRDMDRAENEYKQKIKDNGGKTQYLSWSWCKKKYEMVDIPKPYVHPYKYVKVDVNVDDVISNANLERAEYTRDGKMSETSRNKLYKRFSKKEVRNEWKKMRHKVMRGEDYDAFNPCDAIGKQHIWNVW